MDGGSEGECEVKISQISFRRITQCEKCGKDKTLVLKNNEYEYEWICESCLSYGMKATLKDGLIYCENGKVYDLSQAIECCPNCKNETVACVCLGDGKD